MSQASVQGLYDCFQVQLWRPDWPAQWPHVPRLRGVLIEMHRELRLLQREMAFWQVAQSVDVRRARVSQGRDRLQALSQFSDLLLELAQNLD